MSLSTKFTCKKCDRDIIIETDKPIDLRIVKCSVCGNKIKMVGDKND